MRGNAGIIWERPQIVSDLRGASSKRVKIERKLFSGKGLAVPSKSTTSSSRFGSKNGCVFSRARVKSLSRYGPISSPGMTQVMQGPTQIEKDNVLSDGMSGMMLKTSGKSKLLQVLIWRPVRLGRCAMVGRIVSSVSPEQL